MLSATITVYTQNPIYSVLGLIMVFFGTSILLFLLEVEFLAMVFLVVYIGAIAVLFLFVVMMLDLRSDSNRDSLFVCIAYMLFVFTVFSTTYYLFDHLDFFYFSVFNFSNFEQTLLNVNWVEQITSVFNIVLLGQLLYTYYSIPFIVSGLILLLAMIGSIILTLYHNTSTKRQDLFVQLDRSNTVFLR